MKLPGKESHVWYFDVEKALKKVSYFKECLSEDEIEKANKYKFDKDRVVSILARGALRILSGHYLKVKPKTVEFLYGSYGKPDYLFSTPLKFNVTHSGNFIGIAFVASGEVGLDIEAIKTDFNVIEIAQNFFSKAEIQALDTVPKEKRFTSFYRCWTRKESFIKAKGTGLSFPLDEFTVSLHENSPELLSTAWNPAEVKEWHMFSFEPVDGYVGALSVEKKIRTVKYFGTDAALAKISQC